MSYSLFNHLLCFFLFVNWNISYEDQSFDERIENLSICSESTNGLKYIKGAGSQNRKLTCYLYNLLYRPFAFIGHLPLFAFIGLYRPNAHMWPFSSTQILVDEKGGLSSL